MENKYLIVSDFTKNDFLSKLARTATNAFVQNSRHVRVRCINNSIVTDDSLDGINVVIQFCSPENLKFYGPNCKSYGIFKMSDKHIGWNGVVDNNYAVDQETLKIYDNNVLVVKKNNQKLDINYLNGDYIFYTGNDDYNMSTTNIFIEAALREFSPNEPVSCLIKTNRVIDEEIEYIKSKLNMYPNTSYYRKQVVINGDVPRNEELKFLNTGDCYIYTGAHAYSGELDFLEKPQINSYTSVTDLMKKMRYMYMNGHKPVLDSRSDLNSISNFLNEILGENLL